MNFEPSPLLFLCCGPVQANSTKARKLMWPGPFSRTKETIDVRKSGTVLLATLTGDFSSLPARSWHEAFCTLWLLPHLVSGLCKLYSWNSDCVKILDISFKNHKLLRIGIKAGYVGSCLQCQHLRGRSRWIYIEFQASHTYRERLCLKKRKIKRIGIKSAFCFILWQET